MRKSTPLLCASIAIFIVILLAIAHKKLLPDEVKSQFETQGVATLAAVQSGKFGRTTYLKVKIPESNNPIIVLVPESFPVKHNSKAKLSCTLYRSNKIRCSLINYL